MTSELTFLSASHRRTREGRAPRHSRLHFYSSLRNPNGLSSWSASLLLSLSSASRETSVKWSMILAHGNSLRRHHLLNGDEVDGLRHCIGRVNGAYMFSPEVSARTHMKADSNRNRFLSYPIEHDCRSLCHSGPLVTDGKEHDYFHFMETSRRMT